jgi:hypothetical protein
MDFVGIPATRIIKKKIKNTVLVTERLLFATSYIIIGGDHKDVDARAQRPRRNAVSSTCSRT